MKAHNNRLTPKPNHRFHFLPATDLTSEEPSFRQSPLSKAIGFMNLHSSIFIAERCVRMAAPRASRHDAKSQDNGKVDAIGGAELPIIKLRMQSKPS